MSRRDSLDTVRDLYARRELEDARKLGEFRTTLAQAVSQLELLREHRREVAERLRKDGPTDPGQLQNRAAFLARLDDAITQQEALVERANQGLDTLKSQWMSSRRRTLSIDKLNERRAREAMLRAERAEQKELDELTLRRLREDDSGA